MPNPLQDLTELLGRPLGSPRALKVRAPSHLTEDHWGKFSEVQDPQEARKSGLSGWKPAGDLAPICPDHLVSFPARKTDIQPCSLTIFIFVSTFRASHKPQGRPDRACVKERKILFRIALTRALYDQMAPQLCPFYFPGKPRSFSSFCFEIWYPLVGTRNTVQIKGKPQLVPFV